MKRDLQSFIVILCFVHSLRLAKGASDFDIVGSRLLSSLLPVSNSSNYALYQNAKQYSSSLLPGGYWADINYSDPNIVVWPAASHLNPRLLDMATAYVSPGQPLYQNADLFSNINSAMNFWLSKDLINPNWWFNQINVPISFSEISFLMKAKLTPAQVQGCVNITSRADYWAWTGANLVWMASAHVYTGYVTSNQTAVQVAFEAIFGEVVVTPSIDDGIKQDGSFYQHGQLLYSGGYGYDFTATILPFLNVTVNTSFYINDKELSVFGLHVLDGQQWMVMYGIWDYVVKGREISRDQSQGCFLSASLLAAVQGPRHQEFVEFAERLESNRPAISGNRHYWKSDYMVHRRAGYSAGVRMYSTRTFNTECGNGEGLKSLHLADGVFNLYQSGREYEFIYPTWDWEKIPGITCALGQVPIKCNTIKQLGKTQFVGGASDGTYGVAAYDFRAPLNGTLTAKKAWFFFENEIVALASNITCGGCNFTIVTSINQCLLKGSVYTSNSPNMPLSQGLHSFANAWWVFHDNVGYVIPEGKTKGGKVLGLSNAEQSGTWQSIGAFSGNDTQEVFNFWINHTAIIDSYAYYVIPNISLQDLQTKSNETVETALILENSESVQAVYHTELQIFQGVFWVAGASISFSGPNGFNEVSLSVDTPCVLIVEFSKTEVVTYISDPTQKQSEITVKISSSIQLQGKECISTGTSLIALNFTLPTGEFAGQTTSITCTTA